MPRLYGRRWDKARRNHLDVNPWCVFCLLLGTHTQATVVDHRIPHRGNELLFWDETNWQSLCAPCHNSVKQAIEKGSTIDLIGVDGFPVMTLGPIAK